MINGYIEKMLWKGSGVIIDGQSKFQIMHSAPSTKVKVEFLSFDNGRAVMGGAMLSEGELVISGSLFSHNHASRNGGAIMASGVQTLIYNSTFYDNTSDGNGGGLFHGGQFTRLTNNTFSANTAEAGGGLFN
ncbi:MAG: right-handed parallel beta-helix repeat-containing protein [Amphritea sp.]